MNDIVLIGNGWIKTSMPFLFVRIGEKKYFGKADFILRNSKSKDIAEYHNGSIDFSVRR